MRRRRSKSIRRGTSCDDSTRTHTESYTTSTLDPQLYSQWIQAPNVTAALCRSRLLEHAKFASPGTIPTASSTPSIPSTATSPPPPLPTTATTQSITTGSGSPPPPIIQAHPDTPHLRTQKVLFRGKVASPRSFLIPKKKKRHPVYHHTPRRRRPPSHRYPPSITMDSVSITVTPANSRATSPSLSCSSKENHTMQLGRITWRDIR